MDSLQVPVLIVGGGACGLTASILLSDAGVDHLLIERHPSTSHLPKAHYLNQRTMEIFRQHGLADAVYAVGTPMAQMGKVRWRTTLGGEEPLDARTIQELEAFGGGSLAETYLRDSPCPSTNYPQLRLEPLLRAHADERGPGRVRFNHELLSLTQDRDRVTARVCARDTGKEFEVHARYLVAADGGKTVGPMVGIAMQGPTNLGRIVTSHVSADLSAWWDDACLITWFINPHNSGVFGSGAMVPMGPTWGRHSEEWVIHFSHAPDDLEHYDEEAVVPRLRALLKLPDLPIKVHKVSDWILDAVLAERYQQGRILLAGDAAHRHPPTTGLGLNTAVGDAHNLAWKLAAVIRDGVDPRLIDTYEQERRPVGMRNVDWAMFTALNHSVCDAGMGFSPLQSPALRRATFEQFFADSPMGETRRARAAEVFATQRAEFQAHDLEIGYAYSEGALVPDGSEPPARDPMGHRYVAVARPGHRLPHAWLKRGKERVSTHDLVGRDASYLLITDTAGEDWIKAAEALGRTTGLRIRTVRPGAEAQMLEEQGNWITDSGLSHGGALLVRPDNHVAWRCAGPVADPARVLREVLEGCGLYPVRD